MSSRVIQAKVEDPSVPYDPEKRSWSMALFNPDGTPYAPGDTPPAGADGASAYEVWLANGHSGTVNDYLASLVGPKGDKGDKGDTGNTGAAGGVVPIVDESFAALPAFAYGLGAAADLAVAGGTMRSATQNEVRAFLPPSTIDSKQIIKVKAGTGGAINASPLARRIDDNNFLMMSFFGSGGTAGIQMYARDAGAWVAVGALVGAIPITAGAWYWVVLRVIGDTGKLRGEVWTIDPRKDPDRVIFTPLASTTVTLAAPQLAKFANVNGRCGLRIDPASAGGGANALTYEIDEWKSVSLDVPPGTDF